MRFTKLTFFSFFLIANLQVFSQQLTCNPYSYFGLGLIENNGFCENSAIGSSGIAMPSTNYLNSTNPASYSGLDSSAFILHLGLYGKSSVFKLNGVKQTDFESSLKYIALGFRNSKRWGISVGVVPFSSRGYYISSTNPADGDLGEYQLINTGSGTVNRFYVANAYRISKKLSIGANISYLFGMLKNEEELIYSDESFNSVTTGTTNYFRNLFFDFGLQYKFKILKNLYYLGITYNPLQKLNTSYEKLVLNGTDTLAYISKGQKAFTIPSSIGIGLGTICFKNQLKLTIDYKYMQWSKSNYHYNASKLSDSWQINTGAAFNSDNITSRNYWNFVSYRVGFRYEKSYLTIKSHQLNEIAFTAGVGLPSKNDRTTLNVSYEYAIMGSNVNGLIKERYNRIILGIALKDKWFQKRKFY